MAKNKAIGIIGMHRSGTSAMTRAVNLLGAFLGDPSQLMPGNKDNPEGFWENKEIVVIQESILRHFSRSWADIRPLPYGWWESKEIKSYRVALTTLIQNGLSKSALWAWKDPRTSLLLPLWLSILEECNTDVCFLIALRNPLDVASSLAKRDGFSKAKSLALWQLYSLSAFYWTRNLPRLVLGYDELLADGETNLRRVAEAFHVSWPAEDGDLIGKLETFLRHDLRHGQNSNEAVFKDLEVSGPVEWAFRLFVSAQESPRLLSSDDFNRSIGELFEDYCSYAKVFAPVVGATDGTSTDIIQVFWSQGDLYSEAESTREGLVADGEFHTYDLALPIGSGNIRLDPISFPGYVEITSIELVGKDVDGAPVSLCRWGATRNLLASAANVVDIGTDGTLRFVATSHDPQIFLDYTPPSQNGLAVKDLSLQVTMLAHREINPVLGKGLEGLVSEAMKRHEEEEKVTKRLGNELLASEKTIHALREDLAASEGKTEAGLLEIADLKADIALSRTKITHLEQLVADINLRVENITNSISWRIMAPLRILRKVQLSALRGWRVCRYMLVPGPSIQVGELDHEWVCADCDPWFLLDGVVPGGWVELKYNIRTDQDVRGSLYYDLGTGFTEKQVISLPRPDNGVVRDAIRLPENVLGLRLDPLERPASFFLDNVTLRHISRWRLWWNRLGTAAKKSGGYAAVAAKAYRYWRRNGWRGLWTRLSSCDRQADLRLDDYASWVKEYDTLTSSDIKAIRCHLGTLKYQPLISVIMPVYNTDEHLVRMAIESVRRQVYPNWELCIADDASPRKHVRAVLEEYQALDDRIKLELRPENGHISHASNSALALATGEFIALLDHDDELADHALYMVVAELNAHPDAALIYSDEDKIDLESNRYDPYFKSEWNPDLFYGQNMVNHLGVYMTEIVRDLGGFRPGLEGSQDYDLVLRVIERITPERIRHIPHVLYHWRSVKGSAALAGDEKSYATDAARRALQEYFDRNRIKAEVVPVPNFYFHRVLFDLPAQPPMVSVIIPTRNGKDLLEKCVDSVYRTGYENLEVIVIDNRSDEPETLAYLAALARKGGKVLSYDKPFNYSAINNWAATLTEGEILLLLNNDVETQDSTWLFEMLRHACRPEVGIVGSALYYPDDTLQHGGVILGIGGVAGHAHLRLERGNPGYFGRALLAQDVSAVTGACMMVRKDVYWQIGGLNEELPVAFNDIDFCLRVREKGYRIVFTPFAALYHHESATRGYEDTPEKKERFIEECNYMSEHWGSTLDQDPYYNPNLTLDRSDFSLAWPPRVMKSWKEFTKGSGSNIYD